MKKIDIHAHTTFWKDSLLSENLTYATPEQLKKCYEILGVDKGFLLPIASPDAHYSLQPSEEIEYVAKQNSDVFYWFCNIDPKMGLNSTKSNLSYLIERYKQKGAIGLGEITVNLYVDDPLMENLFYHCEQCDIPVTIHFAEKLYGTYGLVDELHLPRFEKILKKFPKLKFLGHSACFWNEIGNNVTDSNRMAYVTGKVNDGAIARIMRECPNLYCDLSANSGFNAMTRDPDYTYRFIEEFSDRMMFGTDICRPEDIYGLSAWLDESYEKGCISEDNYRKICRENAIRIFKLNIE